MNDKVNEHPHRHMECPHCKNDGLSGHPHVMTEEDYSTANEELVSISEQHFICGRCKIESPFYVYVRRGSVISHMRDENGNSWPPENLLLPTADFSYPDITVYSSEEDLRNGIFRYSVPDPVPTFTVETTRSTEELSELVEKALKDEE